MYRGKVTKVDAKGVYVQTAEFGVLGPCQAAGATPSVDDMVLAANVGSGVEPDLVVLGVLPGTVTPPPVYTVGISGGYGLLTQSSADLNRELSIYQSMGIGWLRIDVDWSAIEVTEGTYVWTVPDRVVAAATAHGMRVIGVLAYSPLWATSDAGETHAPPTSMSDYATFCAAAAARYPGLTWEIWNEANHSPFWTTGPDPAGYTDMVQAAYTAIKAADAGATVLAGGLSPEVDDDAPEVFTAACYSEGIQGYFDGWSVHPYCYPALPSDATTITWNTFQRLPLVRAAMVAGGDTAKKIWLTEYGAPTGTDVTAVSEALQSSILTGGLSQASTWDWIDGPLCFYSGRDRGTDLSDREQNFGFIRDDWTSKPAHNALTAAMRDGLPAPAGVPTRLVVDGDAESERYVEFQTGGVTRWVIGANPDAETGSDAGSNLVVARYGDDGVYIDNPLDIGRAAGAPTMNSLWIRDGGGIDNANFYGVDTDVRVSVTDLPTLIAALADLGLIYDGTI